MPHDRRATRRIRTPGVRATYESAAGDPLEAEVLDIGKGGLFLRATHPIQVGKRMSFEIREAGGAATGSVLGRVIWVRAVDEGESRPRGVGVKFIDAEDDAMSAIDRLIEAGERADRGIAKPTAPAREQTVLGVGVPEPEEPTTDATKAAPILVVAPAREATILGVGLGDDVPTREVSIPIDLVAKRPALDPPAARAPATDEHEAEASLPVASAPKRRGGRWVFVLLVLAVAGGAGYKFRDRARAGWRQWGFTLP